MSTSRPNFEALARKHGGIVRPTVDDQSTMPGYGDVPSFLRQNLDMSKVKQVVTTPQSAIDRNATASVDDTDPYKIKVLSPDLYGPPILNHELTHTFQDTRNDPSQVAASVPSTGRAAYDYGGVQGLANALKNRKTVSAFNYEQQAEMVKDYKVYHDQYLKKAAEGKITPADERQMYQIQQVYHPFIAQMAIMPGKHAGSAPLLELLGVQKQPTINTKPQPPGLPSYDTPGLGVLPADPLMGGKSQSTIKSLGEQVRQNDPRIAAVGKAFPRLAPYLKNVVIMKGKNTKGDDRGLEFYPPWESENPNKGKITIQLFGPASTSAIGGDIMHYLGAIDPKTKNPVDPAFFKMKQAVMAARTPQQDRTDRQIYADAVKNQGEKRSYKDWLQQSRIDAYIRGYVTPELGGKYPDEWRKNGWYNQPNMKNAVETIKQYVTTNK